MADAYEIQYQGKSVGMVRTEKQGLYYCFHCRCSLPDEGMYRIHVRVGDKREDLGICIPVEGKFGMDKKVPLKRLGQGEPIFQLVPKDWKPEEHAEEQELSVEEEPAAEPDLPVQAEEIQPEPQPVITEEPEGIFVPVSENEPFEQLDMLENAVLEVRDEQMGIVIQE